MNHNYDEVDEEFEKKRNFLIKQRIERQESLFKEQMSKINSREELIGIIVCTNDTLERKMAFLRYDQLLIEEIKKGDK
jgi:hypothetical protein